ncbi:MAG: DMT family transporter [Gemmatimonadaceae bacterium]|nr:DMT family transporter [Gemmatimonadaceae bacterium]
MPDLLATAPRARTTGLLYTILAATGFAAVSVLTAKALATGLTLATILAWRYLLSAIILSLWVLFHSYRPIPRRTTLAFIVIGGFGQALVVYLALSALRFIPAATLAFLFYTYPLWVTVGQAVRGAERVDRRTLAALALSFVGIVTMVGTIGVGGTDWRGVALALGAAILYGAYIPTMRTLQGDHPVVPSTALSKLGAAAMFVAASVASDTFTWRLTGEAWGVITTLAIGSTVLPSVFFLMGLVRLGAVRTAIVSTIEPFLTALLAAVVLAQPLSGRTLMGGAFIAGAMLLLHLRGQRLSQDGEA